jgi:hypothetical protein
MSLFDRLRRREGPPADIVEAFLTPDPRIQAEAAALMPASVRGPEGQRFATRLNKDILEEIEAADETDEDVAFLAELASQIGPGGAVRRTSRVAAASVKTPFREASRIDMKSTVSPDEALQIFQEFAPEYERPQITELLRLEDEDIGDLVDDLDTTAAALRQRLRKAA